MPLEWHTDRCSFPNSPQHHSELISRSVFRKAVSVVEDVGRQYELGSNVVERSKSLSTMINDDNLMLIDYRVPAAVIFIACPQAC